MAVKISIVCDSCGREGRSDKGPYRVQAQALRWTLKNYGWKVGLPKGQDVCTECRAFKERAR